MSSSSVGRAQGVKAQPSSLRLCVKSEAPSNIHSRREKQVARIPPEGRGTGRAGSALLRGMGSEGCCGDGLRPRAGRA